MQTHTCTWTCVYTNRHKLCTHVCLNIHMTCLSVAVLAKRAPLLRPPVSATPGHRDSGPLQDLRRSRSRQTCRMATSVEQMGQRLEEGARSDDAFREPPPPPEPSDPPASASSGKFHRKFHRKCRRPLLLRLRCRRWRLRSARRRSNRCRYPDRPPAAIRRQ